MANFIYGDYSFYSVGDNKPEAIRITPQIVLVREDNGKELDYGAFYTPDLDSGVRLITKKVWHLSKDHERLARFDTEDEAKAELRRIVEELKQHNVVVEVKCGNN